MVGSGEYCFSRERNEMALGRGEYGAPGDELKVFV